MYSTDRGGGEEPPVAGVQFLGSAGGHVLLMTANERPAQLFSLIRSLTIKF